LGSWVALQQTGDSTAMLMGDLVLLPAEVGRRCDADRIAHVVYLYIEARGHPEALATAVHTALTHTRTPLALRAALDEMNIKRQ